MIDPNFHLDNVSDFLNKNLSEAEDGLPFLIRKEQKETPVEGLLIPKVREALKKIVEQSMKGNKYQKLLCH